MKYQIIYTKLYKHYLKESHAIHPKLGTDKHNAKCLYLFLWCGIIQAPFAFCTAAPTTIMSHLFQFASVCAQTVAAGCDNKLNIERVMCRMSDESVGVNRVGNIGYIRFFIIFCHDTTETQVKVTGVLHLS